MQHERAPRSCPPKKMCWINGPEVNSSSLSSSFGNYYATLPNLPFSPFTPLFLTQGIGPLGSITSCSPVSIMNAHRNVNSTQPLNFEETAESTGDSKRGHIIKHSRKLFLMMQCASNHEGS